MTRASATMPAANGEQVQVDVERLPTGDILLSGRDTTGQPVTVRYQPGDREHAEWLLWLNGRAATLKRSEDEDQEWKIILAVVMPIFGLIGGLWEFSQSRARSGGMMIAAALVGWLIWTMLILLGFFSWL